MSIIAVYTTTQATGPARLISTLAEGPEAQAVLSRHLHCPVGPDSCENGRRREMHSTTSHTLSLCNTFSGKANIQCIMLISASSTIISLFNGSSLSLESPFGSAVLLLGSWFYLRTSTSPLAPVHSRLYPRERRSSWRWSAWS